MLRPAPLGSHAASDSRRADFPDVRWACYMDGSTWEVAFERHLFARLPYPLGHDFRVNVRQVQVRRRGVQEVVDADQPVGRHFPSLCKWYRRLKSPQEEVLVVAYQVICQD